MKQIYKQVWIWSPMCIFYITSINTIVSFHYVGPVMSHCTWDAPRGCSQKIIRRKKTMSVSHIQQDAGTIDPPFSWPFPMVPSRLHCRSDNRRACSPSMSCCSLSPMWLERPSRSEEVTGWILATVHPVCWRVFEWDAENCLEDCF